MKATVDLSVEFCGHRLKNPLIAGSCDFARSMPQFEKLAQSGVGGIVMKSITDAAPLQSQNFTDYLCLNHELEPWRPGQGHGAFYSRGGSMLSEAEWDKLVDDQLRMAQEKGIFLIGSICASEFDNWAILARKMAACGLPCLELNFGNPHFVASQKPMGARISQAQDVLAEVIKSVTAAVSIPVIVKVSPQISSITDLAKASKEAGARALTVSHRFQGLIIDVMKQRPLTSSWGGYGGHWMVPIAAAYVAQVAQAGGIQVCGSGGVGSWRDVLQFLMCGAGAVQLTTALMLQGYGLVTDILEGLNAYCGQKEVSHLNRLNGAALGSIQDYAKLPQRPPVEVKRPETCRECTEKPCEPACFFDAVQISGQGWPLIDQCCNGCGLCMQVCPYDDVLHLDVSQS